MLVERRDGGAPAHADPPLPGRSPCDTELVEGVRADPTNVRALVGELVSGIAIASDDAVPALHGDVSPAPTVAVKEPAQQAGREGPHHPPATARGRCRARASCPARAAGTGTASASSTPSPRGSRASRPGRPCGRSRDSLTPHTRLPGRARRRHRQRLGSRCRSTSGLGGRRRGRGREGGRRPRRRQGREVTHNHGYALVPPVGFEPTLAGF